MKKKPTVKITKGDVQTAIDNNYSNVAFHNKGAQARFEKNKRIIARQDQLRKNAAKLSEKAEAKRTGGAVMPEPEQKHITDLSKHTDDELLKAISMLGLTVTDMIDGGVDMTRAIGLQSKHTRAEMESAANRSVKHSVHVPQKSK